MGSTRRFVALASLVALGACGEAPTPGPAAPTAPPVAPPPPPKPSAASLSATPDAEFRRAAPTPGAEPPFVPPKIEAERLSNGIRVLVVERHELPIVAVQVVADRGADQVGPGLGAFAGAMLLSGTKTRSALALSDALERLGAGYGAWADFDGAGVRAQVLAPKLGAVLDLLADVVLHPAFAKDELERERSRRLTALAQENDRPATLLGNAVAATLYPAGHPYASSLLGTEAALKAVTSADLARFHGATFQPDRITVAVAGDVTKAAAVAEAGRVFGAWKGTGKAPTTPVEPPPPAAGDPRVVLIDRPGATQSNVSIALPGVARSNKDFDALLVMNTILGGQFSSRLNMNLREKNAYTYGVRSGFDFRHGPGPFSAGGAVFRDKTDAAVREMLGEVERIRREPVSEEELADAKANLVKGLPARFESVGETSATAAALSIYGLPLDEFATRPARIARVSRADVQRVAEQYLRNDRLRVLVVGDASAIKAGLAGLGLGAVDVRQAPKSGDAGKGKGDKAALPKAPEGAKAPAGKTPAEGKPPAPPPKK